MIELIPFKFIFIIYSGATYKRIEYLEDENILHKDTVKEVKSDVNKNTIILSGVPEDVDLIPYLIDLLKRTMDIDIDHYEINNVFRFGKPDKTGNRHVYLSFVRYLLTREVQLHRAEIYKEGIEIRPPLSGN